MNDYSSLIMLALALLFVWNTIAISRLRRENQELKQRVAKLEPHPEKPPLSSNPTDEVAVNTISASLKQELIELKQNGELVKAVKLLRENTELDLLQAKRFVDKL